MADILLTINSTAAPILLTINSTAAPIEVGEVGLRLAGVNGKSAYEIALANEFIGTEAEWLASLKGDDGDIGIMPTASASVLGGIKVGENLKIMDGVLSVDDTALQTYVDTVILGGAS